MTNQYADLSNPQYLQSVMNSIQQSGGTLGGSGWGDLMANNGSFGAQTGGGQPGGQMGGQPGSNLGGFPQTQFDGNPVDQQTGPNTYRTMYGGQPQMPQQPNYGGTPQQPQGYNPAFNEPYNPVQPGQGQMLGRAGTPQWAQQQGGYIAPPTRQQPGQYPGMPPYREYGRDPSTYSVSGGQDYGLARGPVPQGMQAFLRALGFPEMGITDNLTAGRPLQPYNAANAAQQLGGVNIASPQSMNALGPSGQDYFAGLIESILGMPIQDYLYGAYQPFQGLNEGRKSRTRGASPKTRR